jgi:hypothetical protein
LKVPAGETVSIGPSQRLRRHLEPAMIRIG